MEVYEYKSWQTINLPAVSGDTWFRILDHYVSTNPDSVLTGVIYDGLVLDGFGIQNLNEILSQYVIPSDITFTSSVQTDNSTHFIFYIYYTQDDWLTWTYDQIIITYDWSYETRAQAVLSEPIVNTVDYRQFFLYSVKPATPDVQQIILVTINNTQIDSFQISGYTCYNYVYDLNDYDFTNIDSTNYTLRIGGSFYSVKNTCNKYCIYYLNQYGGWDSMLFNGRELESDNLSRLSYKKNYIANSLDFNKVDYLTTLNETWSLNTSYLTDIQSSKMINLMGSNRLYIHDLETGKITPINITNSKCERKTYKNQGRKMSVYTIEVASSQPKYRV